MQPAAPAGTRTVSVVVSRPESSLFWMQIVHRLARELTVQGWNLMYTYLPAYGDESYTLPSALTDGSVSGVIVLNIYSKPLLQLLAALPLPKVFLDTVPGVGQPELGGDLLLLEGRDSVRQITGRLLDQGYRRLSFIGDVGYAQTNADRYKGLSGRPPQPRPDPLQGPVPDRAVRPVHPLRGDQPLFGQPAPAGRTAMCAPATTSPITSSSITTTAACSGTARCR